MRRPTEAGKLRLTDEQLSWLSERGQIPAEFAGGLMAWEIMRALAVEVVERRELQAEAYGLWCQLPDWKTPQFCGIALTREDADAWVAQSKAESEAGGIEVGYSCTKSPVYGRPGSQRPEPAAP